MPHKDLISRMRASKLSLSVSEQRVADLCLSDPRKFSRMPVGEIAELAHVSKPTVVRFCRSIGFEGLQDLKRRLANTAENCAPFIHQSVSANEKPVNIAYKLIDNVIASMLGIRESIQSDVLLMTVDSMLETRSKGGKIICFGIGASALAVEDVTAKLYRLGQSAFGFVDGHSQCLAASLASKCDTFLVFSNSGRTREVIEACEIANKRGATTVAITSTNTPLAFIGKYRIASDNSEDYENYSPMLSRLQQLVWADILVTCFALRLEGGNITAALQEFAKNVEIKRFGRGFSLA